MSFCSWNCTVLLTIESSVWLIFQLSVKFRVTEATGSASSVNFAGKIAAFSDPHPLRITEGPLSGQPQDLPFLLGAGCFSGFLSLPDHFFLACFLPLS